MAPLTPQNALIVLSLLGLAISAAIYVPVLRGLRRRGGQVQVSRFAFPELTVAAILFLFFSGLVALSLTAPETEMTVEKLLGSALTFGAIVFALVSYLFFRGFNFGETFGFRRLSPVQIAGRAVLLLVGAFPLVGLASAAMQFWLKDHAAEQELVQLFRTAAEQGDQRMMAVALFACVVVAPICEEWLFRGFFYAVGKRFIGAWPSALVTSVIFAAFHGNLVSLAGLTVLALAFTAAYEFTGSLAVPMTMHALFNGTSLGILYLQAIGRLTG